MPLGAQDQPRRRRRQCPPRQRPQRRLQAPRRLRAAHPQVTAGAAAVEDGAAAGRSCRPRTSRSRCRSSPVLRRAGGPTLRGAAIGVWITCLAVVCAGTALAQGPVVVAFDEGHFNVHSLQTPYKALGEVASELGFVPRPHTGQFSAASLEGVRILVACCARAAATGPLADQGRPAHRDEEPDAPNQWVREGGALLLV